MTKWIERYRRAAEERYQRLDVVLAEMNNAEMHDALHRDESPTKKGKAS